MALAWHTPLLRRNQLLYSSTGEHMLFARWTSPQQHSVNRWREYSGLVDG